MAHKGLDGVLGDFQIMPKVTWEDSHPTIKFLERNKDVVIKEYLQTNFHKEEIPILDSMSQIKAEVIIPIFIDYKLIGILGIGKKKTGDIFDPSDLNLLRGLVKRKVENNLGHTHYMEEQTVFASKVAHDLRSPFNWILNEIENLRVGVYGKLNQEQTKSVSKIFEGNQNLERNIRAFFELTVLLQHKVHGEYQVEPKDLKAIIVDIVDKYQAAAKEKGIEIAAEFPGNPPVIMVLVNPRDIRRVFENLINNALRYTPKKGKIAAGCKIEEKESIQCWVSDTGIGMPRHALPHVFKPFFHLHAAGEDKQSGVGLGLVIVKEIVDAHGGRIWVESKEGKGTTFYFTLSFAK